jgi:very-short-patch-repair endonuclease
LLETHRTTVDVSAPRGARARAGIEVHRRHALQARDRTTAHGMPITTVARTLLDLGAVVRAHRLERAVAQAERLRLYDHRSVVELLARCRGHRGAGALRAAVDCGAELTRSDLEARVLAAIRRAGLPAPRINDRVVVPGHAPLEADFHWPAEQLIVETDGYETHGTRAAFDADRRRDAALQAAGYRVLRFTARSAASEVVGLIDTLLRHG